MSCEICGRSSCTRSFHSLEDQEKHDNPEGYLESQISELEIKIEKYEKAIENISDAIESDFFGCWYGSYNAIKREIKNLEA